jgi:tripartite-type tricarboxylate transporter receptor subunit TctC
MGLCRRILIAASLALLPLGGWAQGYPEKPVRMVVGFPPGGTTDVIARLLAQGLSDRTGKTFIVENRGGASGNIGAEAVAKSPPDGYTLLLTSSTHGTASSLYSHLGFDPVKSFAPIAILATTPYVLVTHPSIPARSMAELIQYLKERPGQVNYASTSPGTGQHLSGELLKRMAGVDIVHVPYKGSGQTMPDLLSGRITMMFENIALMTQYVNAKQLNGLAITSLKGRSPLLPEVPTAAETGLPGFEVLGWFALLAPAGTSPEIVRILNAESNAVLKMPAVADRLTTLGAEPIGGTPADCQAFIEAEIAKWGAVIREAGIKLD